MNLEPIKTEIKNVQKNISAISTSIKNLEREGRKYSDIDFSVQKDLLIEKKQTLEKELEDLRQKLCEQLKIYAGSELAIIWQLNPRSEIHCQLLTDLQNIINNFDIDDLDKSMENIKNSTNILKGLIIEEFQKQQAEKIINTRKSATDALNNLTKLNERFSQMTPNQEFPLPTFDNSQFITCQQKLEQFLNGIGLNPDESNIDQTISQLNQLVSDLNLSLDVWERQQELMKKGNKLIEQLNKYKILFPEDIANQLNAKASTLTNMKSLIGVGDIAELDGMCEEVSQYITSDVFKNLLKNRITEIKELYGWALSPETLTKLADANEFQELATALQNALTELMDKKIITDQQSLTSELSEREKKSLATGYADLHEINKLRAKGKNNQHLTIAEQTRLKESMERIKKLKGKKGAFQNLQHTLQNNETEIRRLHDSQAIQNMLFQPEITQLKVIKMPETKKNKIIAERHAIIEILQKTTDPNEIRKQLRILRAKDRSLLGGDGARMIHGQAYSHAGFLRILNIRNKDVTKKITLLGGTTIDLPEYLVNLTQNLGLENSESMIR